MENSVAPATPSRAELSVDDNEILNKILNKHHVPSVSNLDTESLLSVVTDFLNGAVTGNQAHLDKVKAKAHQTDLGVPARLIQKFCCEMKCGCNVSVDKQLRETTLSMFSKMSVYSWESKAVLALSAYAIKYGDFLLLDQIYQENQNNQKLVKPMTILKTLVVHTNPSQIGLPKKHGEITTTILEVTKLTVQIKKYNFKDVPPLSEDRDKLPMAVYLTIKTIIACASQFSSLNTTTDESQPSLLSTLHSQLTKILDSLKVLLHKIERFLEGADKHRYQRLWELFVIPRDKVDYVEALKAIIYTQDDVLIKRSTKTTTQVKIDALQKKHVLLFISGLDISMVEVEIDILKKTYADSKVHEEHLFEMVWVPVVEQWTAEAENMFKKLQAEMTWYTVQSFSVTDGAVVKFLKKAWHFHVKPIVIVLNPEGEVESENAIHMIKFWGIKAFPFTDTRQKELSEKTSTFTLDVIFDFDSQMTRLIKQNEYILLYGGTEINTELIEKLKDKAMEVTETTIINHVNVHGNRHFWNRLESLLFSRMHNDYDKVDEVFHQIQELFGYNKVGMWVMLSEGPKVVISGEANNVLNELSGTRTALDRGCYHYWLQAVDGKVPKSLKCLKCERTMKKYVTFECCHDDEGPSSNFPC